MTAFSDPVVLESSIPLIFFYNEKVERIRVLEYERHSVPLPIRFDVSESYSGGANTKLITIESESVKKPLHFDFNFDKTKRIYET